MKLLRHAALWLTLAAGLGTTETALAAFGCYDLDRYPAVYRLTGNLGKLQASLGRDLSRPRQGDMQIDPWLVQDDEGVWKLQHRLCTSGGCSQSDYIDESCKASVPEPELSLDELKRIAPEMADSIDPGEGGIQQKIGGCVEQGGIVWFGITFYCGEGVCGAGGIGRYDTHSGKLEVRRPQPLLSASVSPILFDGKYLWVGTYSSSECIGEDPVSGLVRYDWATDTAVSFGGGTDSGKDPGGPCGFRFNDLYLDKQGLWASSDMGLARLANPQDAPAAMHWTNYVPDSADAKAPLKPTDCATLYGRLLKTLPRGDWPGGATEFGGHYEQFSAYLESFNPALAAHLEFGVQKQ